MARGTIIPALQMLFLAISCTTTIVHGQKEWTVGDNRGWSFGVSGWENGKRIKSGDVLVFKYDPRDHNVVQVGEGDYNSCTVSGPSRTCTSGDDHIRITGGKAFFLCSLPDYCQQGMKIVVTAE